MIEHAPELMEAGHVINAIGMAGVFMFFMVPSIALVLFVYGMHRRRKKKKLQREYNKAVQKAAQEQIKRHKNELGKQTVTVKNSYKGQNSSIIHTEIPLFEMTPDDIPDDVIIEPQDKARFSSLELEFDEMGRVKQL